MAGLNAFEHGGNLYRAVRHGASLNEILDFSANINPLGLSTHVRQTLLDHLDSITFYPDAEAHALKKAISDYYNVDSNCITAGNGAVELLYVLCNYLRPRRVLVTAPTFSEYEKAARSAGSEVSYFYLEHEIGFKVDSQLLITAIQEIKPDIVFLGNPNNPTGTLLTRDELEPIIVAATRQNTVVVVDESFLDFLVSDDLHTCRPLLPRYQNLLILHSLTKFYAIPGLRLGFALGCPSLTSKLHQNKDPWNVNALAQYAGVAALKDIEYQSLSKQMLNQTKDEFYAQLQSISKLKPYKPAVNFILINIEKIGMTSAELRKALADKAILVRDCSNYPGLSDKYIRLAVKLPDQNQIIMHELQYICR